MITNEQKKEFDKYQYVVITRAKDRTIISVTGFKTLEHALWYIREGFPGQNEREMFLEMYHRSMTDVKPDNVMQDITAFSKEVKQPNQECGIQFLHCKLCLEEMPSNQSPKSWARLNVAWTRSGIQVWCVRHEVNVAHLDFMGNKVAADMSRTPIYKKS